MAIYDEERDYPRMLGAGVLTAGTIAGTSAVLFVGFYVFRDSLEDVIETPNALPLLAVLLLMAPLEALTEVFSSLFAAFAKARTIFFRRHLLGPGLQFAVALTIVLIDGSPLQLATGYVASQAVAIILYSTLLLRLLREKGILQHLRPRAMIVPVKEVMNFSIPLISNEVLYLCMHTVSVFVLAQYWGAVAVAEYRAVWPAARLNQFVYMSFVTLYLPMAARLFRRGDASATKDAYWHTAAFLAVMSFPVFAATVPFAEITTVALFGERYAGSADILALLSIGYFLNACLGFNSHTLQAMGRVRYLLGVNVFCAVLALSLSLLLVPHYGAIAVAAANCVTLVVQNALNQLAVSRALGTGFISREYWPLYLVLLASAGLLSAVSIGLHLSLFVAVPLALVVSAFVLLVNRRFLRLGDNFPELLKVPGIKALLK
jgi:O-antigen/teichoic acid export membrane protein